MSKVWFVVLVLLILLSLSSGVAKVLRLPQEVGFFEGAGMTAPGLVAFGLVQVAAGLLMTLRRWRIMGAALAAVTFAVSAGLIFRDGQTAFGVVSLVPVLAAGFVVRHTWAEKRPRSDSRIRSKTRI